MYQIDNSTAAVSQPAATAAGSAGFFTDGNPATSTPATIVPAEWLNAVMMELMNVVTASGATANKAAYSQVLTAMKGMFSPVVGSARNLVMSVASASASATLTADEIIVESALGGQTYRLASFSKTINLATTGAGGMDTGTAPVSGYVALYAIWNPTTQTAALLAKAEGASAAPSIYGGANMPSGYTASALVSVWPTNGSGQFVAGYQQDRAIDIVGATTLTTSTTQASPTALSISAYVPKSAKYLNGTLSASSTSNPQNTSVIVYSSGAGVGTQGVNNSVNASGGVSSPFRKLGMATSQTLYYSATSTAGTPTFSISVTGYEI